MVEIKNKLKITLTFECENNLMRRYSRDSIKTMRELEILLGKMKKYAKLTKIEKVYKSKEENEKELYLTLKEKFEK